MSNFRNLHVRFKFYSVKKGTVYEYAKLFQKEIWFEREALR